MRWEGDVACVRNKKTKWFVGTHGMKKLLGGHRRRWWNNIKMDLQDMGYGSAEYRRIKRYPETVLCPSVVSRVL